MNISKILMTDEKIEEHIERWGERQDPESKAIMTAVNAVQDGRQVVDLRTVIANGGINDRGRFGRGVSPKIAIAPVYRQGKLLKCWNTTSGFWSAATPGSAFKPRTIDGFRFKSGTWRMDVPYANVETRECVKSMATVPTIPPGVSAERGDLIAFEVEWRTTPTKAPDPAILKHISGWLYIVGDVWDLTDLESAVLS